MSTFAERLAERMREYGLYADCEDAGIFEAGARAALELLAEECPVEEPDRYDGDNHGDTESSAYARSEWWRGVELRKLASEIGGAP